MMVSKCFELLGMPESGHLVAPGLLSFFDALAQHKKEDNLSMQPGDKGMTVFIQQKNMQTGNEQSSYEK